MTYALIAFAAVFFVVGIFRVVEFKAVGITGVQRMILIPFHVLGTGAFTGAMVLLAIDPLQTHKDLMKVLFFSALFTLFPMHIYLGIKRRIKISRQQ